MLKKVTDDFADAETGDALVEQCVTSVTTDRTMAEIDLQTKLSLSHRGRALATLLAQLHV